MEQNSLQSIEESIDSMLYVELESVKESLLHEVESLNKAYQQLDTIIEYSHSDNDKQVAIANAIDKQLSTLMEDDKDGLESYIESFKVEYQTHFDKIQALILKVDARLEEDEYKNRTSIDIRNEYIALYQKRYEETNDKTLADKLEVYSKAFDISYIKNRLECNLANKNFTKELKTAVYNCITDDDQKLACKNPNNWKMIPSKLDFMTPFGQTFGTLLTFFSKTITQKEVDTVGIVTPFRVFTILFVLSRMIETEKNTPNLIHVLNLIQNLDCINNDTFTKSYSQEEEDQYIKNVLSLFQLNK